MPTDYSIYTIQDLMYGQARINYELVEVNEALIEGLTALVEILKTVKVERSGSHGVKEIDLSGVVALLEKASGISKKVAEIKPPGCEEPYPD